MTQQGGGVIRPKCFRGGWNAKQCDFCRSSAALLFCHVDSAFMCMTCDAKFHTNADDNKPHARVWMCDVCEQAPAFFTCKADAASLCVTCDHDIHSVNPLARRHHRNPIVPFYDSTNTAVSAMFDVPVNNNHDHERKLDMGGSVAIPNEGAYIPDDQWIFQGPINKAAVPGLKSMEYLFAGSDQMLEFDNYPIVPLSKPPCGDSVVPVQTTMKPPPPATPENKFEFDLFAKSSFNSYLSSYTTSLSKSVSASSMDVGVVPDGNGSAMSSDMSNPFSRNMMSSSSVDNVVVGINHQTCPVAVGMDREARVLRYKEKRKNRKFVKTIRYASRKAYAEIRPRIKGRFAKRTDAYSDFANDFMADALYGVVPSL